MPLYESHSCLSVSFTLSSPSIRLIWLRPIDKISRLSRSSGIILSIELVDSRRCLHFLSVLIDASSFWMHGAWKAIGHSRTSSQSTADFGPVYPSLPSSDCSKILIASFTVDGGPLYGSPIAANPLRAAASRSAAQPTATATSGPGFGAATSGVASGDCPAE